MNIYQLQQNLLIWYQKNKRDLPWRGEKDPYKIWVSEIMLQQTKVDTVIPYYQAFHQLFPTIQTLASASEDQVLKAWEGLGYYSRARNLHRGVQKVQEKYGGKVPDDKAEILNISGIGPYTAGAILSIAYNQKIPAVDGNVLRVISRIYNLFDDITKSRTKSKIEAFVEKLIPDEYPGEFNQALMELGALICTPKSPHCLLCPVMELCKGRLNGNESILPIKEKKKSPKIIYRISLLMETDHHIILNKRSSKGLLANMWELPSLDYNQHLSNQEWEEKIYQQFGIICRLEDTWLKIQHTFSHIHWNMQVFKVVSYEGNLPVQFKLVSKEQLSSLAFPKAYQEIIQEITGK